MEDNYLKRVMPPGLKNVKNIIAVGSGKGGVGKSTVASLLAIGLKNEGKKVGVLDADIYGPSQLMVMGRPDQIHEDTPGQMVKPIERNGVHYLSMAAFKQTDDPTILRAPMVVKWLQYLMGGVEWGDLDYLLIDLPPGTGDIQLTIAQQSYLNGAVIVTTSNTLACDIAAKGLAMFSQLNIPIVGVVENMSKLICGHCDEVTNLYKGNGAQELASKKEVPFLAALPMHPLMTDTTEGMEKTLEQAELKPVLDEVNKMTVAFLASLTETQKIQSNIEPTDIRLTTNGGLSLSWLDETTASVDAMSLRAACPCAHCVDEVTGEKKLDPMSIPLNIKATQFRPVGRYGMSVSFSDGHGTGIFQYAMVKEKWSGPGLGQATDETTGQTNHP